MSDLPTNHTTSFHRRFLPYRHFIYLSNSSRHACSRWRRHVPSRSRNDIHRRPIRVREIHHRCALSWAVYSFSQRGQRKPALDEQDVVRYLDPTWVRCHVAGVVQGSPWAKARRSFGEVHTGTGTLHLELSEAVDVLKMSHAVREACRFAMFGR